MSKIVVMPKISIIIPVYNAAQYIEECLDSIIQGELKDTEIITVDDGSSDDSLEILYKYRDKFGIIVIAQENSGPAKARNKGLEIATGEYVGFVDSDDWVEPNMFSEMYKAAKDENADIIFCNVFRNKDIKMRKYLESGVYDSIGIRDKIYPILINNLDETEGAVTLRGSACLRIFRRELLNQNNIRFDERLIYNEDGLFCIAATLASNCYVYLGDSYLYHNRYVEGSLTKRYITNLWDDQRSIIDKLTNLTHNNDYNFSHQINKKAMEVAIYSVENICKRGNKESVVKKLKAIKEIIYSQEIQGGIKLIDFKKLKRINKLYWISFSLKSPLLAMFTARHRMKKNGSL